MSAERSSRSGCEKASQSSLSPGGGGCWGREAPHELAGKRPQGAGAHVNEETTAAALAIHPLLPPPSSLIPPLCLLPLRGTPSYYCPQAQTETGAMHYKKSDYLMNWSELVVLSVCVCFIFIHLS